MEVIDVIEVVAIALTAGVTVAIFFHSKSKALHDRITRIEDKQEELSRDCLRREELHLQMTPIRDDVADIRRRIDDIFSAISVRKKT